MVFLLMAALSAGATVAATGSWWGGAAVFSGLTCLTLVVMEATERLCTRIDRRSSSEF